MEGSPSDGGGKRDESPHLSAHFLFVTAFLIVGFLAILFTFAEHAHFIFAMLSAAAGIGALVTRVLTSTEYETLPPATDEFHALADPSRPLGEHHPVSGPRGDGAVDIDPLALSVDRSS